ncbi:basement membrane-specific heparan sulfate proteoglycan core protein-like [Lagopus muta]|uniref:basement membrane-specific heparan sulfate proteoglycan core protein-like n=1 Tax=Lagopus muta TaxID=64668 RepID=UPI0020A01584|nr:basement membrane-specific heparan sulfate proteoglycan core protein-like [Lagopus muta]
MCPQESGKAKDFVGLGLKDGHLVFSYQLGSGEATIVSEDPVNDGEWHHVMAARQGRRGWLQVDGEEPVFGESPGTNIMANSQGSVYIGGAPDPRSLTAGKFLSGVSGCVRGLVLAPTGTPGTPLTCGTARWGALPSPPAPPSLPLTPTQPGMAPGGPGPHRNVYSPPSPLPTQATLGRPGRSGASWGGT